MNFIQKIRAGHVNRHGFLDVLVGVIIFQAIYVCLYNTFGNFENVSTETDISISRLLFLSLVIAPYIENLALICIAALHTKIFHRAGLFVVAPLIMTSIHFIGAKDLPVHYFIRGITLFGFFYVFLKQYDLHKLDMGVHRALLLSSAIHFAVNVTAFIVMYLLDSEIDAETIFSAQPGE